MRASWKRFFMQSLGILALVPRCDLREARSLCPQPEDTIRSLLTLCWLHFPPNRSSSFLRNEYPMRPRLGKVTGNLQIHQRMFLIRRFFALVFNLRIPSESQKYEETFTLDHRVTCFVPHRFVSKHTKIYTNLHIGVLACSTSTTLVGT
jgi:hypothetical protein